MNHPNYPIKIRKTIERNIRPDHIKFIALDESKADASIFIYRVEDTDFYFELEFTNRQVEDKIAIDFKQKPINEINSSMGKFWTHPESIGDLFRAWLKLVDSSINYKSPFDQAEFFEAYEQDFFSEEKFDKTNEEKYNQPLSLSAQKTVKELLEKIQISIDGNKEFADRDELKSLSEFIPETISNLGTFSAYQVILIITRNLTILRMYGFPLFIEIIKDYEYHTIFELVVNTARQLIGV